MAMNNHGQAAMVGLMIGVFIFLLGMGFIDPMRDVITEVRASDQLDCDNSSITDGAKMTCLAVDLTLPYFILIVLATAGAWVSAKIIG
jgi:hypothetical protein